MQIDKCLSFEDHIKYIYHKSCRKFGAIKKVRIFLNYKITLMLHRSLVVPLFDYCDTVYMNSAKCNLDKLQLLQNKAWLCTLSNLGLSCYLALAYIHDISVATIILYIIPYMNLLPFIIQLQGYVPN